MERDRAKNPGPGGRRGARTIQSLGAPRWKQRALYDAMKDAFALGSTEHRLARLSVYDQVEGIEIGALLDGQAVVDIDALVALLQDSAL